MNDHIVDANKKVDHIIKAAKDAGLTSGTNISGVQLVGSPSYPGLAHITVEEMGRFYAIAYKAGMERAAEICESRANMLMLPSTSNPAVLSVAAAIRSEAGKP